MCVEYLSHNPKGHYTRTGKLLLSSAETTISGILGQMKPLEINKVPKIEYNDCW